MCARLPPELIARIQSLAEAGQSCAERQKLRARMERVNKEWYEAVNHITHYLILRSSKAWTLTNKLRKPKWRALIGAQTRSVAIDMRGFQKGQEIKQLCKLLELFVHVEEVAIDDWNGAAAIVEGARLVEVLARFTGLRHFTLQRSTDHRASPISPAAARRLFRQWPELETLTLDNIAIVHSHLDDCTDGVLQACTRLRSLNVSASADWSDLLSFVTNLSPTLRTLRLVGHAPCSPNGSAQPVLDQLLSVAPGLRSVCLGDNCPTSYPDNRRGALDTFVARLTAVRRLAIYPGAVTDLGQALAPLGGLAWLTLGTASGQALARAGAGELVAVIEGSAALRSLRICAAGCRAWTAEERREVEQAAAGKEVRLVWE